MFEPITVTIHLEDVDVVGGAIEQRAVKRSEANTLVRHTLVHSSKIAGDDDRAAFVALTEDLQQQLGAVRHSGA